MKQISAFDLDYTLIASNSSFLFYHYLISKGFYPYFSLIQTAFYSTCYHLLNLSLTMLHKKVFERFVKGVSFATIQEEVKRFLQKDFYRFLYYPAFERLRRAQHQGDHTIILSNAPSFLVGPIAKYLEVNDWYASHYAVNDQGNFESITSVLLGEGKAKRIDQIRETFCIHRSQITAYSDSDLDLSFLYAAGTPVATNPNPKLLKVSKENAWEII